MSRLPLFPGDDGPARSAALKAVRRHRGLSAQEVADGMSLALRTYEHFEAGEGRLNLDYLRRFARVTGCDPDGLAMAIRIGSPEFAVRSADNKFMTIFTIALKRYDVRMGDRIRDLDARALVSAFEAFFDSLAATGDQRAEEADLYVRGDPTSPDFRS